MGRLDRLPIRIPDGTRYIIEGRDGCILRYLEFPDGRHVDLPAKAAARQRRAPVRRRCPKKSARARK